MMRTNVKSTTSAAFIFAGLALITAVTLLGIAVFTGRTASIEDATRFDQRDAPDVRYVMNYEIDPSLFSFYAAETGQDVVPQAVAQHAVAHP